MTVMWNGSIMSDVVLADNAVDPMYMIERALDNANASEIISPKKDLQLLSLMTKQVTDDRELQYSTEYYFQDNTEYLDSEEFAPEIKSWQFTRRDFAIKDGSFDSKTFKNAREKRIDLNLEVAKRTVEILATYTNIYKPYVMFETLLTVPTDGGAVDHPLGTKYGAIRNNKISKRKIKNYDANATNGDVGSLVRNNWRSIGNSVGINFDDLSFYTQLMEDVEGIYTENLVFFGSSADISLTIRNCFSDFSETLEEVLVGGVGTGVFAKTVNGVKFIAVTTSFPRKVLALINTGAEYLITHRISEVPEYQGVAIELPTRKQKFLTSAEDFEGSKIVIQEEGYFMTGILDVMFIDIDEANWDNTEKRIMQPAGFTKVINKQKDLKSYYYKSVIEKVSK